MTRLRLHRNGQHIPRGFTLVELLVTIAVLAIIVTIGVPSFRAITTENRAVSTANELQTALQLGRSAAVTRSRNIEVCASNNTDAEPTAIACSNSSDWSTGWIVRDPDADEIQRVRGPVQGSVEITGPDSPVTFSSAGVIDNWTALSPDHHFHVNVNSGRAERCVELGISGRSNVTDGDCS